MYPMPACAIQNRIYCCLQYTYFLLLIFVLEAMVGVLAYVYEEQVTTELQANLNNTFLENYRIVQDKTKAIDSMQINVSIYYITFTQHTYPLQTTYINIYICRLACTI